MKKDRLPVRIVILITGLALLLPGCEDSEKAIAKPQIIQKKIEAQPDRNQPNSGEAAAALPSPPKAPTQEIKPSLAQVKPEGTTAVPEPTTPPKPLPPPPTERPAAPASSIPVGPAVAGVVSQVALQPDEGQQAASTTVTSEPKVASLLSVNTPDPYNPKGKVDPFDPLLRDETTPNVVHLKPKKRAPSTPLEKIDIGQLKLVAIIAARSGNLAMVQESSGKGYIIKPGTFIGTNSGKITSIETDKVLFEEEYEDVHGKTVTQKKEITLPKPPGEL